MYGAATGTVVTSSFRVFFKIATVIASLYAFFTAMSGIKKKWPRSFWVLSGSLVLVVISLILYFSASGGNT